ncbi:hypothetical protein chiPu_0033625, partial [Chiloscyllium punctatum]|nr:hypothetical protein [Chiloscyllium punctatum]
MAEGGQQQAVSLTENLLCPICLSLLSDASTLDCGHTFCRVCITGYWDSVPAAVPSCPQCRRPVPDRSTRPVHALRSAVEQLRSAGEAPPPPPPPSPPRHRCPRCPRHREPYSHLWEAGRALLCSRCLED